MKPDLTMDDLTNIYSALSNWADVMESTARKSRNEELREFTGSRVSSLRTTRDKVYAYLGE